MVNFIDSHTHLSELTWENLEMMYLTGIREMVSPVQLMATKRISHQAVVDMWNHQLGFQVNRAAGNLIRCYSMLGLSMVSVPEGDCADLYDLLIAYLQKPGVVAIGEIGFEPGSKSCNDPQVQEELVRNQLLIAKKTGKTVNFHVPHPADKKKQFTEKTLDICRELGMPFNKVIIDHCSDANLPAVLESGAYAAISIQPWRALTAEMAADLVLKYGAERIMLDSDCGTSLSDPLAVARAAFALAKKGAGQDVIEKVCRTNCLAAYGI